MLLSESRNRKKIFRVLITYCLFEGKNTVETINLARLRVFGPKSTFKYWYAKLKCGEMSTENGDHRRHPKEVVIDENRH